MTCLDLDCSTLSGMIRSACLLEAAARKPGNVHPHAPFEDVTFNDFVRSADIVAPILAQASDIGISQAIRAAVEATQQAVGHNTNLGIILVLGPLAAVHRAEQLRPLTMHDLLDGLTVDDTVRLYSAIRMASPGGMGSSAQQDLSLSPTLTPRQVMSLAADRDQIAALWVDGFEELLEFGVETFLSWCRRTCDWEHAIVGLQLSWLERHGDSLIGRKLGAEEAAESRLRAGKVLDAGWPEWEQGWGELAAFDQWLRDLGHRRNPGTTADIIAGILFVTVRKGLWQPPARIELGTDRMDADGRLLPWPVSPEHLPEHQEERTR